MALVLALDALIVDAPHDVADWVAVPAFSAVVALPLLP